MNEIQGDEFGARVLNEVSQETRMRPLDKNEIVSDPDVMMSILRRCFVRSISDLSEEGVLFIHDEDGIVMSNDWVELDTLINFPDIDEVLNFFKEPPNLTLVTGFEFEPSQYEPSGYIKNIIETIEQLVDEGRLEEYGDEATHRRRYHGSEPLVVAQNSTDAEKVTSQTRLEAWLNYYPQASYLRKGALLFAIGFGLQILASVIELLLIDGI